MKKTAILLCLIITMSCANESRKASSDALENEVMASEAYDISPEKPEVFAYQNLYTDKLQQYYDLHYLKAQHPEFKTDIILQLKAMSTDTISPLLFKSKAVIQNVETIGVPKEISDSISKTKLRYALVSEGKTVIDSIIVSVITKTIVIDNKEQTATKVRFSKF